MLKGRCIVLGTTPLTRDEFVSVFRVDEAGEQKGRHYIAGKSSVARVMHVMETKATEGWRLELCLCASSGIDVWLREPENA
jgi:hypothetical protein